MPMVGTNAILYCNLKSHIRVMGYEVDAMKERRSLRGPLQICAMTRSTLTIEK